MATNPAAWLASRLLAVGAVQINPAQPFKLTSGRFSPVYVDCRCLISYPDIRQHITDMACAMVKNHSSFDAIAGGETAGIPFAAWIASALDKPMLYVRKKPKGFGRMAQIEGHMPKTDNPRVLLVEDLASDGGSKNIFIQALRDADARVDSTLVVFNYGPVAVKALSAKGVNLLALCDWKTLLQQPSAMAHLSVDEVKHVLKFLADYGV